MTWSILRPKRADWFRGFLITAVVSMVVYLVAAWWAPWTPGRLPEWKEK